jgi:hypothetical protein
MIVKCGVSGENIEDGSIFVCHHCGMPVCARDGWVVSADNAFDDSSTPVSRAAMHCPGCVEEYHKGAARHHGWEDPALVQSPMGAMATRQVRA